MPTYGYRCPACSTEFDVWQRMSDEPGAVCPSCGAAARRLFYPAGIVFKGTGFYATDSRKSPTAGGSGTGGDGKKPASTTPAPPAPASSGDGSAATTSKDR